MADRVDPRLSTLHDPFKMYRDLVETSQDLIWQCDAQGRYTYLNPAWESALDQKVQGMLGRKFWEFQTPEFAARDMRSAALLIKKGAVRGYETVYIGKSGKEIHLVFNAKAIFDDTGEFIGARGIAYDITEQKQAEQKLKENELFLSRSQILGHLGFFILELPTRKPHDQRWHSSPMTDDIFGIDEHYPRTGEGWLSLIVQRDEVERCFNEIVFEQKSEFAKEYQIIRPRDNERRWIQQCLGELEFDAHGMPTRMFCVVQDITERKVAEEAAAAEKERLAAILGSIGDGVVITDPLGRVSVFNKIAEELTGWTQREAEGRKASEIFRVVDEDTKKPRKSPIERVLCSGETAELTNHTVLIARDGTQRVIANSGVPIKNAAGEVVGVVFVFRDLTEKQRLLERLQRADRLDSLGILAGGIAHDFNNLLAGIFGFVDLAKGLCPLSSAASNYLDRAFAVLNRAKDLTQQLLTFSKGGAPMRKTGHLGPLIKESAMFALSGTNIVCDFHIPEDLDMCDFDENQIAQVIDNIVINAQQAMPTGGKIEISASNVFGDNDACPSLKGGRYVKISIKDSGMGIPPAQLNRIFDPFFTTKQTGSGLGLATCYSILQKHDGCIDVESTLGKGSTFYIFLPVSSQKDDKQGTVKQALHSGSGTVLIMDDEDFIRTFAGELFKSMGYTVLEAEDGLEAILVCADAKQKGIALVCALFDLTVPGGMGGKEAIAKVREQYPNLPIFASSGYSEDPVIANPTAYGFTDSIRKPYLRDDLSDMLNRHLRPLTRPILENVIVDSQR